jgi:hypothetical protein
MGNLGRLEVLIELAIKNQNYPRALSYLNQAGAELNKLTFEVVKKMEANHEPV